MVVISPFFIQETSIYEIKQHMVLIIPGTRPEIINLSPTIRECESPTSRSIPASTTPTRWIRSSSKSWNSRSQNTTSMWVPGEQTEQSHQHRFQEN